MNFCPLKMFYCIFCIFQQFCSIKNLVAQFDLHSQKWNFFGIFCQNNATINKKSHSTLRAKRAMVTFWVDKSSFKLPKMSQFSEFLKTWSLLSNSVSRQVSCNRLVIAQCLKITENVAFDLSNFGINFVLFKSDMSESTIWPQALGFQKIAKLNHF